MFKVVGLGYLAMFVLLASACSARPGSPVAGAAPEPASVPLAMPIDSPTLDQLALLKTLTRRGAAPELANEVWLNSPPLTLAGLRGKVVLVDFWTFG
jgi:hypothetical protein